MKRIAIHLAILAVAALGGLNSAQAQNCGGGCSSGNCVGYNSAAPGGGSMSMTSPTCAPTRSGYPRRIQSVQYMLHDHFSPDSRYAYSRHGIDASRMNEWNQAQMQTCPWHGNYSYWRWNQPTALVVPPTAAFQSEYNWGVGQTRSIPIYHQFGVGDAGMIGGGSGDFSPTPYWPSTTSQFGIYPVRGPWH